MILHQHLIVGQMLIVGVHFSDIAIIVIYMSIKGLTETEGLTCKC